MTTIHEFHSAEDKMTIRRAALLAVVIVVAFLPTPTVHAQTTNPPYLSEMPAVDRVMAEIEGPDPMHTAARQMGAFWQLQKMVEDLAGDRRWRNQLTTDEGTLIGQYRYGYALASKPYDHIGNAASHPDKPAWFKLYNFYLYDEGLLDELLNRFFSPEFRTAYYQSSGKQPPSQRAAAPAPPTQAVQAPAQPSAQPTAPAGENMEAYLEQGHGYYRDKDYAKAIDAFRGAIALEHPVGAGMLREGDEDEEWLLAVERHVAQNPGDPLALILLGDTYVQNLWFYPEVLDAYHRVLELKPASQILASTHYRIGLAYRSISEPAEALRAAREALRLKPEDTSVHVLLSLSLYDLEQYPEALAEIQEAIRLQPGAAHTHNWAGVVYFRGLKQYEKAVASFQEAIRLNPNRGLYRLLLGQTYLAMGRKEDALQVYRELQTIDVESAQQLYAEINESS